MDQCQVTVSVPHNSLYAALCQVWCACVWMTSESCDGCSWGWMDLSAWLPAAIEALWQAQELAHSEACWSTIRVKYEVRCDSPHADLLIIHKVYKSPILLPSPTRKEATLLFWQYKYFFAVDLVCFAIKTLLSAASTHRAKLSEHLLIFCTHHHPLLLHLFDLRTSVLHLMYLGFG